MMVPALSLMLFSLLPCPAASDGLAPFAMPALDAPEGAADVSFLLDPPAGGRGFVEARDGRFLTGGKRIRFWGVNVCFAACFPSKEDAPRIAARLAGFGVNCARFHHMDMREHPGGIFRDGKLEELSPEALDRLDFFVAELAKRGIYANLNLHVSRWWSRSHGWPAADRLESFDKMVDIFHPELIEAQKEYARDLLGHRNPYTGRRYAEEPAVAMVEITNEDSLFEWGSMGALARLPEPYAGMLRERWNGWLRKRHGSPGDLRKAWSAGEEPLGKELLRDPAFDTVVGPVAASPAWALERHEGARARLAAAKGPGGEPAARIDIEAVTGTIWHVQFKGTGLRLEKGRFYTVRFLARADREKSVGIAVGQERSPWANLGLAESARLGTSWKPFRFGFVASAGEDDARLSLSLGSDTAAAEIAAPSIREGGRLAILEGESLDDGSIALFPESGGVTEARLDDRLRFLRDLEREFFVGMRKFLREEIGVRQPITGTIAFGALGTQVQAEMDFVDQHSYWQHPDFPRRPWDSRDWIIGNRAMSADGSGGTLPGLALTRVLGKPYTVTEYNHPAPLDSQAETVPVIASFAAAQDWDGVFLFAYSHSGRFDVDRIGGFFDIDGNPAKMGFLGVGALIFSGGRLGPAAGLTVRPVTEEEAVKMARADPTHVTGYLGKEGAGIDALLEKRWALRFGATPPTEPPAPEGASGRIDWVRGEGRGLYVVDAPAAKVACGLVRGPIELDGVRIEVEAPGSASIVLVARDGEPLGRSRSILLAACGRAENTGMGWSADRSTVGDRWGTGPARIEAARGRIRIAGAPLRSAAALDGRGRKAAEIPLRSEGDATAFTIGEGPATLWYSIER
jgi:hypothetical protein